MSHRYEKLLEPVTVRGFTLKHRIYASNSQPHFLQGPEEYPSEGVIRHMSDRAKNGAAMVTIGQLGSQAGMPKHLPDNIDIAHFPDYNIYDTNCQNYLMQLADMIHLYKSLAIGALFAGSHTFPIRKFDGSIELIPLHAPKPFSSGMGLAMENDITDEISQETLLKIAESFAQQSQILQSMGFDGIMIHMCYRGQLLGQMISSISNKRTDEFGGSIEGRAKYPLLVLQKIREAVGEHFIIELQISGEEKGGNTSDEVIWFLKQASQYADIAQIRTDVADPNHPTGYNLEETPFLELAAKIKAGNVGMFVSSVAGFLDPDTIEKALEDEKVDMVAMARTWISNPDYGQCVLEERPEDIVPCLRCNKCHGRGARDPFVSVCSVNPLIGIEQYVKEQVKTKAAKVKRVAIIGGGPAGLRAALLLKEKGHEPEIYEASGALGGAIRHADAVPFKWPLAKYKKYLIDQVEKHEIPVFLNTKATPEMIKEKEYDVVVTALGASPVLPKIPGLENAEVLFYEDAFFHPEKAGERVAVIGGGEIGCEIGLFLAGLGKQTTVLEMRDRLAADATLIHFYSMMEEAWNQEPNMTGITGAKVLRIEEGAVIYEKDGKEAALPCDTIIAAAGMRAHEEAARAFYGAAREYYNIGDSYAAKTIQQANRDALAVSLMI